MTKKTDGTLFSPGKAQWLMEHLDQLDEGERALLLAIAELSKDTGRELTEEERAALDKLASETQGFDPVEIRDAVQKIVQDKSTHPDKRGWSDVSRKLKQVKHE
jgi:hypothetical protein